MVECKGTQSRYIYFDIRNRLLILFLFMKTNDNLLTGNYNLSAKPSTESIKSLAPILFWYFVINVFDSLSFICIIFFIVTICTCWWLSWTPGYQIYLYRISEMRYIPNHTCGTFVRRLFFQLFTKWVHFSFHL